jgi:hypothetical protein
MIIRTIEIDTEEHAHIFDEYIASLSFAKSIENNTKISSRDLALGIGRPLTDAEWDEYFESNPNTSAPLHANDAKTFLKNKLA